jgi:acyl carrier protein
MISTRLAELLRRELKLDAFEFTDDTKAFEVPGWDSLRHVELLSAIEREFGIRFKSLEVLKLQSVGDLQTLIDKKAARS